MKPFKCHASEYLIGPLLSSSIVVLKHMDDLYSTHACMNQKILRLSRVSRHRPHAPRLHPHLRSNTRERLLNYTCLWMHAQLRAIYPHRTEFIMSRSLPKMSTTGTTAKAFLGASFESVSLCVLKVILCNTLNKRKGEVAFSPTVVNNQTVYFQHSRAMCTADHSQHTRTQTHACIGSRI